LFKVYTAYATCGLLYLVYEMCSVYLIVCVLWAGIAGWVWRLATGQPGLWHLPPTPV